MAVMASEAPLDHMSFNEKAHPAPVPSDTITMETELNGNTTHYDALFDDEPATTNGTHLGGSVDLHHNLAPQDAVASKTVTAGDSDIAPITHVTSGIAPVAPFAPTQNGDSIPDANDVSASSTVSQAVEQPVSNLRAEPPTGYQVAVEEAAVMETDAMDLGETEATSGGAELPTAELTVTESLTEKPAVQSPTDQPMSTESAAVEPLATENPATEDKMDTTADFSAEAPVAEEPVPSIETAPEPEVPSVEPLSIAGLPQSESAQTGQVRPREDDEETGPVAKRARTETGDDGLPTTEAPVASSDPSNDAPTASIATQPAPVSAPATSSTSSIQQPALLDSSPMTSVQHKFILTNLRKAKKVKSAEWFLKPVDAVALNIPTYPTIITQPMDLGTLEQKLKDNVYATANDFMADFQLIVNNSITFNGTNHPVSVAAMNFKAYFVKTMSGIPKGEAAKAPTPIITQPKKPAAAPKPPRPERKVTAKSPVDTKPAGFVDQYGTPIIRRDSSAQNDRPKREIHPPKRDLPAAGPRPKKKKHQLELKFCQHVMSELTKKKHIAYNYPFMVPVDPVALNIPNYHKIIKKPMDLGTVQSNLNASLYGSAKDFYNDVKLVFQNCFKFNPATDEVHKMGKLLEDVFEKTWANKDQWLLDNAPASEVQSEEDEEEEEEEELEEDPAEAMRRMQEIQAQIAALSAEAMKLSTIPGKRPSPKVAAPKSKSKATSSKSKRSSGAGMAAAPKPSKTKPVKKPHKKLTLDQKREVSEGIANLDEGQMRRAVQIIRNGVPHLRNVQDDELELDIDEIPDDVVYQLYQFVKAKIPRSQRAADPEPDYEDDDDEFEVTTKPSSNRKKNKPMKATEQEEQIRTLKAQLEKFKGNSGSEQSPDHQADESSDEDASESSEEE